MSELDQEDDEADLVVNEMKDFLKEETLNEPPVRKVGMKRSTADFGLALVHTLRVGIRSMGGLDGLPEITPVIKRRRKPRKMMLPKPRASRARKPVEPRRLKKKKKKPPVRSLKKTRPVKRLKKPVKMVAKQKPKAKPKKAKPVLSGKARLARLLMKARRK